MSFRTRPPKLNSSQVAQIKRRLADGAKPRELAAQFQVSTSNIRAIRRGDTWGWVEPAAEATPTAGSPR